MRKAHMFRFVCESRLGIGRQTCKAKYRYDMYFGSDALQFQSLQKGGWMYYTQQREYVVGTGHSLCTRKFVEYFTKDRYSRHLIIHWNGKYVIFLHIFSLINHTTFKGFAELQQFTWCKNLGKVADLKELNGSFRS